jgi:hypothetical protein
MRLAKRGLREEPLIDRAKGAFGGGFYQYPAQRGCGSQLLEGIDWRRPQRTWDPQLAG